MTLAVLLLSLILPAQSPAASAQTSPQSAPSAKPADAQPTQDQSDAQRQNATSKPADEQPTQDQGTAQKQQNPPAGTPPPAPANAAPSRKPSATAGHAALRSHAKKKVLPPDCNPAPDTGSAPATADSDVAYKTPTDSASPAPTSPSNAPPSTKPAVPPNCPPAKVVVRQGGTSEPSIQVVGGGAGSPDGDKAKQMLQAAEDNLKKIGRRQLSSDQRDMVTQVRQFMDQSKNASASGDLERARTLAWKAQLLSEELINPQK